MPLLQKHPDAQTAARAAAEWVKRRALEDASSRGVFTIALAGGSTPKLLYEELLRLPGPPFPWGRTEIFFSDERCVPPTHEHSNFGLAQRHLLDALRLPGPKGVHRLCGEAPDPVEESERAEAELLTFVPDGVLDLVLLGMGPDGHVASLFPGSPALAEKERLIVAAPAARPPHVTRLTFSLPMLNRAREVVILATGAEKADALRRVLSEKDPSLPATLVSPVSRRLAWFVDDAAAADVPRP